MKPAADTVAGRRAVLEALERREIDMRVALKRLRRTMGLTHKRYADLVDIDIRVLIDFERGVGSPTLETLRKIGKPFGLEVTYVPRGQRSSG